MSAETLLREGVKYPQSSPLRRALVDRVNTYFDETKLSRRGGASIRVKSFVMLGWLTASYLFLVLWASAPWMVAIGALSIGLAIAGVGFCIGHDGGHGAYADHKVGNMLAAMSFDMLGASSYFWHYKHDIIHHQFTNIDSIDHDISSEPFLRLSPTQKRHWYHRFQHWYAWVAYGFLLVKWQLVDDFTCLVTGRIGTRQVPRPKGWDLVQFIGGKVMFFTLAFAVPALFHPFSTVVLGYLICIPLAGIALSTIFQLAHVVEGASFFTPPKTGERMELGWAEHQLATTADFCPANRLVGWYTGGLNFQVEHHLFARVSHVHYPEIYKIVRSVCAEHGVAHHTNHTLWSAIGAHFRLLRELGRPGTPKPGSEWSQSTNAAPPTQSLTITQ